MSILNLIYLLFSCSLIVYGILVIFRTIKYGNLKLKIIENTSVFGKAHIKECFNNIPEKLSKNNISYGTYMIKNKNKLKSFWEICDSLPSFDKIVWNPTIKITLKNIVPNEAKKKNPEIYHFLEENINV